MTDLAQAQARILELEAEVDKHKNRRQHFEDLLNRSIEHENEWTQRALKAEAENAALRQELESSQQDHLDTIIERDALRQDRDRLAGIVEKADEMAEAMGNRCSKCCPRSVCEMCASGLNEIRLSAKSYQEASHG